MMSAFGERTVFILERALGGELRVAPARKVSKKQTFRLDFKVFTGLFEFKCFNSVDFGILNNFSFSEFSAGFLDLSIFLDLLFL